LGNTDYDVVIIGAGAAGCAAAMNLPPGANALLVDRGAPGAGRCCGGLLAPDAQAALADLGLAVPEHVRVRPEPQTVHVTDLDSGREQTYRRNYLNLDRARFDAWLLDLAAARAGFRPHTCFTRLERDGRSLLVHLVHEGREEAVRARCVIAADGADSVVRRAAFPERPGPAAMVAIQVRLAAEEPPAVHAVLFAGRLTDFYAWGIPKPGAVLVGAAFGEARGSRGRFEEILAWYRRRLNLAGAVLEKSARRLSRPRARHELFGGSGAVLLAGEAAGLVSPSSGEGLSFAIESGAAAGRAAGAADPAAEYARAFSRSARRVTLKFAKARVIFSPRIRRWALRLPWCP
jgi:flavin-dependent dehydrogenase